MDARALGRAGRRLLAGAFAVDLVATQAGARTGPFRTGAKAVLHALAWLHVLRQALARRRIGLAVGLALGLIKFTPREGHTRISLFQFVMRRLLFGKAWALPPVVPVDFLVSRGRKFGIWRRHLLELENWKEFGNIYSVIRPFSSTELRAAVPLIFVSDVKMIEQIMTDRDTYPTRGHTGFTSLVGDGLLGLETGEKWAHHRRIISKYLSEKHLRGYAKIVQGQADVFLDKWRAAAAEGRLVNGYYDLSMLTLDIIMEIGTGERTIETSSQLIPEEENDMAKDLDHALQDIIIRTVSPLYDMLPSARIERTRAKLDQLFERLVKRAMEMPEDERPEASILHGLLSAKNKDGSPALSEIEINEEFKTIRGAGHETTGNTLCFMIKLLQENPDKLAKLREEVDEIVTGDCPTFEEARKLRYAHQVMFEALRMFPTVPQFPRVASCDTKLGNYDIPKGSFVFVSQHSINYNAEIWDSPHEFRPERFDNVGELQPTKPVGVPGNDQLLYAYLPFGASLRTCVGQRLAMLEGVQIIAAIVKQFDFKVMVQDSDLYIQSDVTLGPKHGLPVQVTLRQ